MSQTATSRSIPRRLGRGLGSLISAPVVVDVAPPPPQQQVRSPAAQSPDEQSPAGAGGESIQLVQISDIGPNPRQPRQMFDEAALQALANSIKSSGLMQPILLRPAVKSKAGKGYELVAGERRWRAAQLAGLERIPAVVREIDDRTSAEFSLVENLQREDLNPIERAEAFQRLIDEFGLTHADVAQRVGLDRTSVTNHLRLNELDKATKDAVRAGALSLGHAKVLLVIANITKRAAFASLAVRQEWSVRELERRVKEDAPSNGTITAKPAAPVTPHMTDLQKKLSQHLGTKVQLRAGRTKGSGKLIIEFYSIDQFEGLMRKMQFEND